MTTTLYGTSMSRASRCLVALEELGVEYAHVPLFQHGMTEEDRATLRSLNRNGRIPVLDDDGVVLFESMAINLYLADSYGGALWPDAVRDRGRVYQWSLWAQTEMDRPDWQGAWASGDAERIADANARRVATLGVLDRALTDRDYLLGDAFTFADLNVAATISQPNELGGIDAQRLDPFTLGLDALGAWLKRCTSRASWLKVRALP
jgi:glutathione S-transferase